MHTQETNNTSVTNNNLNYNQMNSSNLPSNPNMTCLNPSVPQVVPKVIQDFSCYQRKNRQSQNQSKFLNHFTTESNYSRETNSLQSSCVESVKVEKLEGDNGQIDVEDEFFD